MTDRERVAAAIHAAFDPDCMGGGPCRFLDGCGCALKLADAAIAAMPTWRRIPDEVREGEAPADNEGSRRRTYLLAARYPRNGQMTDVVEGWWVPGFQDQPASWARWQHSFPPTHYAPIPPLPVPPDGDAG